VKGASVGSKQEIAVKTASLGGGGCDPKQRIAAETASGGRPRPVRRMRSQRRTGRESEANEDVGAPQR